MTSLLEQLNPQQQLAVQHENNAALVLAGAGSGKTTVLTTRVSWLITQKFVSPFNILVVTFTNKAAKEIKERIFSQTGNHLAWSGTFHSLCAKILRIDGQAIGLPNTFVIYDSQDQLSLLKDIYKKNNFSNEEFNIKAVQAAISNAKNELITVEEYQNSAHGAFQNHVARVYKIYQHELNKASAVDFDDLLSKTLELFESRPDIREKYQNKFLHVLVDEYQDTNKAQYSLTKLFAYPQNNLFVVGDFCQSIYAWRGADYKNMLQLQQGFPELTEYKLEQNYRSNQNILDAATDVISKNTTHPILSLWTEKPAGSKIQVYEASTNETEARQIVAYIKKEQKEYQLKDMAILYRTNAQSRAFEEALMQAGIAYKLVGGTKFYERKEVKDIIAYLRFAINSADTVSFQRILSLGKRRYEKFKKWLDGHNIAELLKQSPAKILKDILESTTYLDKYSKKSEEDIDRLANIQELLAVADKFESPTQFLENIALIQDSEFADVDPETNHSNTVTLMSLHSAKGLEFGVVFLAGMEEGLLPHARSLTDSDGIEEERRLCYVGITRAKSKLYLTYTRSRYQYGMNTPTLVSRFLLDISENTIEFESEKKTYDYYKSPKSNWQQPEKPFANKTTERRIVIDDSMIEGVLSGDFDVDDLINS